MAKPLELAALLGGGKSLTLKGKTFQVGPQTSTTKAASAIGGGNGVLYLKQEGQIVEGYDLRGQAVIVQAHNVTIRNSHLSAQAGFFCIDVYDGFKNCTIEKNLVDGMKLDNKMAAAIQGRTGSTINVRNNLIINLPTDGVIMDGGEVTQNAFIGSCFATDAHADADAVTVHRTGAPVKITENYVDYRTLPDAKGSPNAGIKIVSHFGPINDVTVADNVLLGGGYNVYVGQSPHSVTDVKVTNNLAGHSAYGDRMANFLSLGTVGAGFVESGNTLFSAAPEGIVKVGSTTAPAPTPVPTPVPTPSPVPATGITLTPAQVSDLKAAAQKMLDVLK